MSIIVFHDTIVYICLRNEWLKVYLSTYIVLQMREWVLYLHSKEHCNASSQVLAPIHLTDAQAISIVVSSEQEINVSCNMFIALRMWNEKIFSFQHFVYKRKIPKRKTLIDFSTSRRFHECLYFWNTRDFIAWNSIWLLIFSLNFWLNQFSTTLTPHRHHRRIWIS